MMFCAGVATGILYWGSIEWVYYLKSPPFGVEPDSTEALEWATSYGMFHWGPNGWAFYALPAIAIGYAYHVDGNPRMRLSTGCASILGRHATGVPGRAIDILFMVGLLGSTGTSLGLGTPMVAAGIAALFGLEDSSFLLKLSVLAVCALLFSVSVYFGIERGIKRLSNLNVILAFGLLAFVLVAGPTVFLLKTTTNSLGLIGQSFLRMSTWTDPFTDSQFVEDWTVFYWAWWVAVGPFMGIFIAGISRGRTIRQTIFGTLVWGSLGCVLFYGILGNYALHLELSGTLAVADLVARQEAPAAIIGVIQSLPFSSVAVLFFCVISLIFMATTFDSTAYSLAACASRELPGGAEPSRWHRLFWAIALAVLPATLLLLGEVKGEGKTGLEALKTAALLVSLPLLAVNLLLAMSILRRFAGHRRP